MRHKGGFTLIELLVVIAIIAILAAILFPVYARIRARGYLVVCLNQARQQGLASKLYAEDYEGKFPDVGRYTNTTNWAGWTPRLVFWEELLDPYIKTKGSFYCCPAGDAGLAGYAFNRRLSGAAEASVSYPSTTILACDAPGYALYTDSGDFRRPAGAAEANASTIVDIVRVPGNPASPSRGYLAATRHFDGFVAVMADSHAKHLRPSQVVPESPEGRSGQNDGQHLSFWP